MRDSAPAIPKPKPSSTTSVGYPGRDGAHSAAACEQLFPGGAELVALPSFSAVADAAAEGIVAFGVLPIESSLSGPVAETHDLLYDSPLAITAETVLPIRHCLVGPEPVDASERVRLAVGQVDLSPREGVVAPEEPHGTSAPDHPRLEGGRGSGADQDD